MVSFGNDELKPHFIYCGHYYQSINHGSKVDHLENFRKMFLKKMKTFGIQSSMLTIFRMERICLITEETAKAASEGKLFVLGYRNSYFVISVPCGEKCGRAPC